MTITIAAWNVNSLKVRLPHLLDWLKSDAPDIVLLQETKCVNDAFPGMEIEELGYNIALHGQKTYNGVAILSKFPLEDISRGLPGDDSDIQARYIEAVANIPGGAMRVASVYVPNGADPAAEKFQYKLRFLDRLHTHMKTLLNYGEMLVIGGDYNIAPTDDDVHNPKEWENSVLTHDEVRVKFRKIINLGLIDAQSVVVSRESLASDTKDYRLPTNDYSWWDYRNNAFTQNNGLRIDHLLLSPQAADKLTQCYVKKDLRALEKPSDHAPVVAEFKL